MLHASPMMISILSISSRAELVWAFLCHFRTLSKTNPPCIFHLRRLNKRFIKRANKKITQILPPKARPHSILSPIGPVEAFQTVQITNKILTIVMIANPDRMEIHVVFRVLSSSFFFDLFFFLDNQCSLLIGSIV